MIVTAKSFLEMVQERLPACIEKTNGERGCIDPKHLRIETLFTKFLENLPKFSNCTIQNDPNKFYFTCASNDGTGDQLSLDADPSSFGMRVFNDQKIIVDRPGFINRWFGYSIACYPSDSSASSAYECQGTLPSTRRYAYSLLETNKGVCTNNYSPNPFNGGYVNTQCEEDLPLFDEFLSYSRFEDVSVLSRVWSYTKLATGVFSTAYFGYHTVKELKNLYDARQSNQKEMQPSVVIVQKQCHTPPSELENVVIEEQNVEEQKNVIVEELPVENIPEKEPAQTEITPVEKPVNIKPLTQISIKPAVAYTIATFAAAAFASMPFFITLGSLGLGILGLSLIGIVGFGYKSVIELNKLRKYDQEQDELRKNVKSHRSEEEKIALGKAIYSNLERGVQESIEQHIKFHEVFGNGLIPRINMDNQPILSENSEEKKTLISEDNKPIVDTEKPEQDKQLNKKSIENSKKRALIYGVATLASFVFTTMTYFTDFADVYQKGDGSYVRFK